MNNVLDLLNRLDSLNEEEREVIKHYLTKKWPVPESAVDAEAATFEAEADSIELPKECLNVTNVALPSAVKKSEYIPGKRGRRKGQVDTNSARQRVFCAVRALLKKGKRLNTEVWNHVSEETGIPYEAVRANSFQCPGIHRAEYWSLEEAA